MTCVCPSPHPGECPCASCPHPAHLGACNGRNGQTANPCPCLKTTVTATSAHSPEWEAACLKYQGRVLLGEHGHWCADWDELPIDETCMEWPCPCNVGDAERAHLRDLPPDQAEETSAPVKREKERAT